MTTYSRPTLVAAGLWLASFLFALYPFNAYELEFFGACVISLFVWSYILLAKGLKTGWEIPQSKTLLFAGLFFLLVVFSLFWSEMKSVTLLTICLFAVMPVTFLTFSVRPDVNAYRLIGYALVPVFFTLGIWAIVQYYFLHDYFYGQARHPLADPSSLGALLSLALFCVIGWMLSGAKTAHKIIALIVACALIGGIFATAARGPVFAFIPGILMMLILLWPRVKTGRKYALGLLLALVMIPATMQMTGGPKGINMTARIGETVTLQMRDGDISNLRVYLWESAADIIKDYPFLGTGFGTFYQYLPEYKKDNYDAAAYYAHNDPLQYWTELGILGPILFYAFVIAAALRTFFALKKARPEQQSEKLVIVTIFCALLSMVVHTHVSFNLYNLSILSLTGFMLAVWFYATGRILHDDVVKAEMPANSPAILNMAVLALPFLLLGGLFFCNIAGEHYTNKARDNLFNQNMTEFADNINKAVNISQGMNFRAYLLAVNVPLTLFEINKSEQTPDSRRQLYDQAVGYMNKVLSINPRNDSAYYYLAKVQEVAGEDIVPEGTAKPVELYQKALTLNPFHLGARLSLLGLYKREGRSREEMITLMEPGLNLSYTSPVAAEYYKEIASLYLEDGNYGKVQDVMEKLAWFQKRVDSSEKIQSLSLPEALMRSEPIK